MMVVTDMKKETHPQFFGKDEAEVIDQMRSISYVKEERQSREVYMKGVRRRIRIYYGRILSLRSPADLLNELEKLGEIRIAR